MSTHSYSSNQLHRSHLCSFAVANSVANAAVYPPNWATLKSPAAGQKTVGGWPKIGLLFIRLPAAALFSSNVPISCQFREFLSLINVQEHSFHQFQGLRCPREQSILIIYFTRNKQCNWFSTQLGDYGYFTAEKHPNLGNWAYDYLIKIGLLWSCLPR